MTKKLNQNRQTKKHKKAKPTKQTQIKYQNKHKPDDKLQNRLFVNTCLIWRWFLFSGWITPLLVPKNESPINYVFGVMIMSG